MGILIPKNKLRRNKMDKRMSEALDRHITGNYGEDQYREDIFEESPKLKRYGFVKKRVTYE